MNSRMILIDTETGFRVCSILTDHGMSIEDALALSAYELPADADDDQLVDRETGDPVNAWYTQLELIPDDDAADVLTGHTWDAIVSVMDDDLLEEIHEDCAPCSNYEFLLEYMRAHAEKFGEPFTVS